MSKKVMKSVWMQNHLVTLNKKSEHTHSYSHELNKFFRDSSEISPAPNIKLNIISKSQYKYDYSNMLHLYIELLEKQDSATLCSIITMYPSYSNCKDFNPWLFFEAFQFQSTDSVDLFRLIANELHSI